MLHQTTALYLVINKQCRFQHATAYM